MASDDGTTEHLRLRATELPFPVRNLRPFDQERNFGLPRVPSFAVDLAPTCTPNQDGLRAALADSEAARWFLDPPVNEPLRASVTWKSASPRPGLARQFHILAVNEPPRVRAFTRRRFVEDFAIQIAGVPQEQLAAAEADALIRTGVSRGRLLAQSDQVQLTDATRACYSRITGRPFPETAEGQLGEILRLVSAKDALISVHVSQVFDTDDSRLQGSILIYSRDPQTGVDAFSADYARNVSLADLRSGNIALNQSRRLRSPADLTATAPDIADQAALVWSILRNAAPVSCVRAEAAIVNNVLMIDRYTVAELSVAARIAVARSVDPGSDAWVDAVLAVQPDDIAKATRPHFVELPTHDLLLAHGAGTAPGAAVGVLCTSAPQAAEYIRQGIPTVLAAMSPTPEHVPAVLTATSLVFGSGGMTSHVAVIARGSGKPCVMGIDDMEITADNTALRVGSRTVPVGTWLSVDGDAGTIHEGRRALARPDPAEISGLSDLLETCDSRAKIAVRANADTAAEARLAFARGASGIGLCRLEHVMLRPGMHELLEQAVVLSIATGGVSEQRSAALAQRRRWGVKADALVARAERVATASAAFQTYRQILAELEERLAAHLISILQTAHGRPIVIRLLDIPLSEILSDHDFVRIADQVLSNDDHLRVRRHARTSDAMMGLRGVRMAMIAPELTEMQIRAIGTAASQVESQVESVPIDLLVPLVSAREELILLRSKIHSIMAPYLKADPRIDLRFGSMIETPRAALLAGTLATICDFLSFGTNDLAQFTWAYSRDTAQDAFLNHHAYLDAAIDPFASFDVDGVGQLIAVAAQSARAAAPGIDLGACGEQCADPDALNLLSSAGIGYVSCSPNRIISARLAACMHGSAASGLRP